MSKCFCFPGKIILLSVYKDKDSSLLIHIEIFQQSANLM